MKYEGIKFTNAGRSLIVPALGLGQVKTFGTAIENFYARSKRVSDGTFKIGELAEDEPIIRAAIARNYPSITEDEVLDFVDYGNYNEIMSAILGTSRRDKVTAEDPNV